MKVSFGGVWQCGLCGITQALVLPLRSASPTHTHTTCHTHSLFLKSILLVVHSLGSRTGGGFDWDAMHQPIALPADAREKGDSAAKQTGQLDMEEEVSRMSLKDLWQGEGPRSSPTGGGEGREGEDLLSSSPFSQVRTLCVCACACTVPCNLQQP